jgi:hypothetical protein
MAWPFSAGQPWTSGNLTVPSSLGSVTNASAGINWLMGCSIANPTTDSVTFTLKDGAGNIIIPAVDVPANGVFIANWNFMPQTGLQWQASVVSTLVGSVWGVQ